MPEPTFSDTLPPASPPTPAIAEASASTPASATVPLKTASAEATSLDVSEENSVAGLYRVAIGPVNTDYYLRVFTRFEAAGRAGASWNWAACLCTLNWMFFRQLWGAAIAYGAIVAGMAFLAWGTARLVLQAQDVQQWLLALVLMTAAYVIPGAWGNAWLYARYRRRLDRALSATATVPQAMLLLNRQASSRQGLAWLALANAVLAGAALGVWIAFPHGGATDVVVPTPASVPVPVPAVVPAPPPTASAAASAPTAAASVAPATSEPTAAASAPASTPSAPAASAASASEMVVQAASAPMAPRLPPSAPPAVAPRSALPASAAAAPPSPVAILPGSAPRLAASEAASPTVSAAASPASKAALPASTLAAKGYYINVGLFAQENNARNARDKLKAAGLAVFTEDLQSKNGEKRTRVRVGPFDTRADADTAVAQIRALGLEALVFRQ